jgi:hypothetical protein
MGRYLPRLGGGGVINGRDQSGCAVACLLPTRKLEMRRAQTVGAGGCGVVTMRKNRLRESLCLAVLTAVMCTPLVGAAEYDEMFCSGDEVADAIDELECAADGVYLSPEVAADEISYRCGDADSERACRTCFKKAGAKLQKAFKAVAKAGLIDRSVARRLKATLAEASDDTCTGLDEEEPLPDDPEDTPDQSPDEPTPPAPPTPPFEVPAPETPAPDDAPWSPAPPSEPGESPEPDLTPPPMPTWDSSFSNPWPPELPPELDPEDYVMPPPRYP